MTKNKRVVTTDAMPVEPHEQAATTQHGTRTKARPGDCTADYLSPIEFARLSGLALSTVRRRIKDGSIKVWQPGGPGTAVRIARTELSMHESTRAPVPNSTHLTNTSSTQFGRRLRWRS